MSDNNRTGRSAVRQVVMGMGVLLLSGCALKGGAPTAPLVTPSEPAVTTTPPPPSSAAAVAPTGQGVASDARMSRCHRELKALQRIDGKRYSQRKAQFDRLMSGAALYAGVRGDVMDNTQSAVDALYRFKADKLCADISQDVLNGLAHQGDGPQ